MRAKHIDLKIGRNKERDFILYPYKKEDKAIMIQSDNSIGILIKETRKFIFTNKGSYSHHLQMYGKETVLSEEIKNEIFRLYEESASYVNSDGTINIFD